MRLQPRLLPIAAAAAAMLFCAKAVELWFAFDVAPVSEAHAQAPAVPDKLAANPRAAPHPAAKAEPRDPTQFSAEEVQLLQSLAQRRDALEQRAADLTQREGLLQAAEQRIDQKIAKLQEMQSSIDTAFKKQDDEQDNKVKSLVKIYETMKPKEAARIFEQLDTPVVLEVLEHMKELKTAPILASMEPAKAKAVTLALAARKPPPQLKP